MRRWNRSTEILDDVGSAAIEFIFAGLLLLVPVVYLVVSLGVIQEQTLGVESGARHIARVVATSENADDAEERADSILTTVAGEYGLDPSQVEVRLVCAGDVSPCPQAGATVTVTVGTRVALPLVPPVFALDRLASIPVEANAVQKVSRFWGAE